MSTTMFPTSKFVIQLVSLNVLAVFCYWCGRTLIYTVCNVKALVQYNSTGIFRRRRRGMGEGEGVGKGKVVGVGVGEKEHKTSDGWIDREKKE